MGNVPMIMPDGRYAPHSAQRYIPWNSVRVVPCLAIARARSLLENVFASAISVELSARDFYECVHCAVCVCVYIWLLALFVSVPTRC